MSERGPIAEMGLGPRPYLVDADDGEALWIFNQLWTLKATAEKTGGRLFVSENRTPGGTTSPFHLHELFWEAFYVLEGRLFYWLGDAPPVEAGAGDFVFMPPNTPHAIHMITDCRHLNISLPRSEAWHRGISSPGEPGTMPDAKPIDDDAIEAMRSVNAAHGTVIFGPPPEVPAG